MNQWPRLNIMPDKYNIVYTCKIDGKDEVVMHLRAMQLKEAYRTAQTMGAHFTIDGVDHYPDIELHALIKPAVSDQIIVKVLMVNGEWTHFGADYIAKRLYEFLD